MRIKQQVASIAQKLIDHIITPVNYARLCWVFGSNAWNSVFSSFESTQFLVMRASFLAETLPKIAGAGSVFLYFTRIFLTSLAILGAERQYHTFKASVPLLYNDVMWAGLNLVTANHFVLELFNLAKTITLDPVTAVLIIFAGYVGVDLMLSTYFFMKGRKADAHLRDEYRVIHERYHALSMPSQDANEHLQFEAMQQRFITIQNRIERNRKVDLVNNLLFASSVLIAIPLAAVGWSICTSCMVLLLFIMSSQRKDAVRIQHIKHELENFVADYTLKVNPIAFDSPLSFRSETELAEDNELDDDYENAALLTRVTGMIEYATRPAQTTQAELLLFGHRRLRASSRLTPELSKPLLQDVVVENPLRSQGMRPNRHSFS